MNIYYCAACHYTFENKNLPDRCPDCGKTAVRAATDSEIADYIQIRAEIAREEKEGSY